MPENSLSSQSADLGAATLKALRWSYGGQLAQAGCQLIIGIVLARILGPAPFGVLAAAWLIIGLANQWADLGLSAALTQRKAVTEHDIRYAFTVQVLLGCVFTLVTAAIAGPVAAIFGNPELIWTIRSLSPIFLIQVIGSIAGSLLRRGLNFRAIQIAQVASYVGGYLCLGIPLAIQGFGAWSLVGAQLVQSLLNSVLLYAQMPFPIKLSLRARPEGLLGFGSMVSGTNVLNWIIASADTAALAKAYGMRDLGLYNRANALTTVPTGSFLAALSAVLFPAYSRTQDAETMRRLYLSSVAVVSMIMFPLFLGIAVAHESVIEGVFGTAWSVAGPLLVPLAISMPLFAIMRLAGPIIWAQAKVGLELKAQAFVAVFFVLVLVITTPISLSAVAWGFLAMNFVRMCLLSKQALSTIEVSWRQLASALRGASIMGACTAPFIWASDVLAVAHGASPPVRLAANTGTGIAAATAAIFLFSKALVGSELGWLVGRYYDRMPVPLRNLFGHVKSAGASIS